MGIGASLVCGLPWSAVYSWRVARWLKKAGFGFLQLVPFRSAINLTTYGFDRDIRVGYVEQAWNPAWTEDGPDPLTPVTFFDRLFFPPREECIRIVGYFQKEGATLISHRLEDLKNGEEKILLEVHPGLWKKPSEIIAAIWGQERLVIDTNHIRRPPRADELAHRPPAIKTKGSLLSPWPKAFGLLLPYARAIHVSPLRGEGNELAQFLAGKETELEEMLRLARSEGFKGNYIAEYALPPKASLNPWRVKETMRLFYERLAEIVL